MLLVYFIAPSAAKNYVLLLASLFFYAWGEPRYIFLMLFTILLGYTAGMLIEKAETALVKKTLTAVSVMICLAILGVFKYADFFAESFNQAFGRTVPVLNLALPIGISFYTFQLISYLIDVSRGDTPAQRDPVKLAVYISMFPQLIAGPIVRYVDVKDKLSARTTAADMLSYGISRFCMGLGKKVLIANTLGELAEVYNGIAEPTVLFTWMYAAAITLQLYFDFSGYSDMAIGLGSILGFEFPENFSHPLCSTSATEFWRRWHITLGSWFRDYLYIPMGGSRVRPWRHLLNIAVVWMATGLWHGASWNFVLWGVFFAVLLIIEKYGLLKLLNRNRFVGHVYLLLTVTVSFVIFDNVELALGFKRIACMFGAGGLPFSSYSTMFYLKDYAMVLIIACVGASELPKKAVVALKKCGAGKITDAAEPVFNLVLLVLSTAFLVNSSFNPFLYFRF